MFYNPEHQLEPNISQYEQLEALEKIDYSNQMELAYLAKMLGLSVEEVKQSERLSPEMHNLLEQVGQKIWYQEMLMTPEQEKIIDQEFVDYFNKQPPITDNVIKEMRPIHQYFKLLIEKGKASKDDERAYFNKRYGWSDAPFDLYAWDNKLAKLNAIIRTKVCERISQEEFEQKLNTL